MDPSQLTLTDITLRYADRVVLDRLSLTVAPGERVGVVGDNGSGKSTLLAVVAGSLEPQNGTRVVHAPGGAGYLPQTVELPGASTVAEAIDHLLADLRTLAAQIAALEDRLGTLDGAALDDALRRYGALTARFDARDGSGADRRVAVALHRLGLPGLDHGRALGTLSGGERSRLALAATLAADPELLLLDEPTNDLDDDALDWLTDRLHAHDGTVVAVTHDRAFLAGLTTTLVEVEGGGARRYGTGYAGYLAAKDAEREQLRLAYERWRADLGRQQRIADTNAEAMERIPRKLPMASFGSGAFRSRARTHGATGRIRNAKERVRRLTDDPAERPADRAEFRTDVATAGPATDRSDGGADGTGPAILLDGVEVRGRLDAPRLAVPRLTIAAGEHVLVTGPNGAGKSTLLGVVAGEVAPDTGTARTVGAVGHLRQAGGFTSLDARTVLHAFAAGRPGDLEEHAEALLATGLFRPEDLPRPVRELSQGQRSRLELARVVTTTTDVLLVDEPTNHLSPALVEELERAFAAFDGTLVLVSHDRTMRERFRGRRIVLDGGATVADTSAVPPR
ncbi:ABC-F family ATP-binding cassette domain-containing protein [Krasilnikoviella flava]|uniref:Macrolide transport system ATP-binding/permease protein n=1 Tax=Krasilnikoviella flava TaxID=526729 RepID=A0A1T5J2B5_9MICO|nr:ABC-F family ATP-binding cassette domain-containing protein [Krasilnikoviella flava]SKC45422.1 macrolide transport system ATP-binding/permease protein [Krasilnikoviella flava]